MNRNLYQRIYKIFPALLFILLIYTAVTPENIIAFTVDPTILETVNQDDFDKKFREGRDLIDREEWARAADKFSEVTAKYPDNKSTDAALYWLAFCQKKQKQLKEADATLERLIERFPSSSWASDARVMKMEIALPLGGVYVAGAVGGSSKIYTTAPAAELFSTDASKTASLNNARAAATAPVYAQSIGVGGFYATESKTPLDREDEIKIAAFQSLLAADPKRAVEILNEVLQPNAKTSETLKIEFVRVLRRPRVFYNNSGGSIEPLTIIGLNGMATGTNAANSNAEKNQTTRLIREALVKSFQNETNVKVRKEIVYTLAEIGDAQSTDYVVQLYSSENDREIKKAIINSLGGAAAFFSAGPGAVFTGSATANSKKVEFDKLMEILRTEKDAELRRLAFSVLQRQSNWSTNPQSVEMIAQMYDAETDEQFKIALVQSLGRNKQKAATDKLLQIARSDRSDKLKLEAIYALRSSRDPEVLRFLENLIK